MEFKINYNIKTIITIIINDNTSIIFTITLNVFSISLRTILNYYHNRNLANHHHLTNLLHFNILNHLNYLLEKLKFHINYCMDHYHLLHYYHYILGNFLHFTKDHSLHL